MRQALNENPVIQAVLVGLLGVVVAFLLITRVAGGSGAEEPPPASTSTAAEEVAFESQVSGADGVRAANAAFDAMEAGDVEGAANAFVVAAAGGFEAGAGLPRAVVDAYRDGKAIALLITRKRGIEDKSLRRLRSRIRDAGNVVVFHAYARGIARYSRITGGVDVSRVPALVVVRPRSQSQGGIPVASVGYGFRGPASAKQAVRDALYKGARDIPYHPYPDRPKGR